MTAREVLDDIKGRLAAATPGPWEWDEEGFMGCGQVYTMHPDVLGGNIAAPSGDLYPRSGYSPKDDMQFIAAAPVDVARLTRAVEEALSWAEKFENNQSSDIAKRQGAQFDLGYSAGRRAAGNILRVAIENALTPKDGQ